MLEPEMTRMSRSVRQMAAPFGRQTTLFGRDRRVAAPGPKSAVFDCIFLYMTFDYKQASIIRYADDQTGKNCQIYIRN